MNRIENQIIVIETKLFNAGKNISLLEPCTLNAVFFITNFQSLLIDNNIIINKWLTLRTKMIYIAWNISTIEKTSLKAKNLIQYILIHVDLNNIN